MVADNGEQLEPCTRTFAGKSSPSSRFSSCSSASASIRCWRSLPAAGARVADGQAVEAGARPEGRRPPRPARATRTMRCSSTTVRRASSCATRCRTAAINVTAITVASPTTFRVEGCRRTGRRSSAQSADEIAATNYDRNPLAGGAYDVHDEAEHRARPARAGGGAGAADDRSPRQRARRRRAEHRAGRPKGDEILVQMPGVTDVARAKEIIGVDRDPRVQARRGRPGASKDDLLEAYNGTAPARHGSRCRREPAARRRRRHASITWSARSRPSPGRILRVAKPGLDENNQPAVHFELKSRGRAQVRQAVGREHRPLSGDHPRQPGRLGAEARRADHRPGTHQRRLHRREARTTCR